MPTNDPVSRRIVPIRAPAAMRIRLSVKRRCGRGACSGPGSDRPSPSMAIVTRRSSSAAGPPRAPRLSVPETYGVAIAPPLPAGFDVVAVSRASPSHRPPCWCHGRGTWPDVETGGAGGTPAALHVPRRGQRPLVGLCLPTRRHRDQHPVEVGHDLGPDDLL